MKRIEDYNKVLPILELYRCVQSEGSRFGRPTIAVRTTGCTHRCYFGEGGWCDSWYTSIHPEKGTFTFNDIIKIYDENPHISEMMLTGGSPTMHPALVNEITHFANERNILVTILWILLVLALNFLIVSLYLVLLHLTELLPMKE
jgi:7-carboxy-7-deazaguanine synthase